jgi:UV DNA damage repair endonuclease
MKCRTQFWKGTTKGSFQQSLVEIGSVISEEEILLKFHPPFSIFSLAAILVGSRDHRTPFWKAVIQGSSHQSLVEIGSVVSDEKILLIFHPPFFSIFSLVAILVGSRDHRTHFWKRTIQ